MTSNIMETRQQTRFHIFRKLCEERLKNLSKVLSTDEKGRLNYAVRYARNLENVKSRWFCGFYASHNRELYTKLYNLSDRLVKQDPFSSITPHFSTFKEICQDHLEQNMCEDDMDLKAMKNVLQCTSFKEVYDSVVTPYNETYFRELVQTLDDAAFDLTKESVPLRLPSHCRVHGIYLQQ